MTDRKAEKIKQKILTLTSQYYRATHLPPPFRPGQKVPYAGRVYDDRELINLIEASLEFWLTAGRYSELFEKKLSKFLGIKYCSLVNSGSSANLLAFMTLTSSMLGKRRINRGDEVITVAAGFPTTVAPIIQYGAVPVFIDITLPDYNADVSQLKKALSRRTKAVMLAHTLGNPFNLTAVKNFCDENELWLIEDNCDALGSRYLYKNKWRYTGTIGDIGTSSFYPPHHITMGEGGAVYTNNPLLKRIVDSMRDWGRDCWCPSGKDDTCHRRFKQQFGKLPFGYDHKYVYSHFGYNLKATDLQAAIGCAQLEKLPEFIKARKYNWKFLRDGISALEDNFILPVATENSESSWFGLLLLMRDDAGFSRDQIVKYLESYGIQTRMLFAGNLIKQPCFDDMRNAGGTFRIIGKLQNTDKVMRDAFWIGTYPGINQEICEYLIIKIKKFVRDSTACK